MYLKNHINFMYRLLTTNKRSLPDFIIVGEAKCGTTSLYNYLENNSKLNSPIKKEIHYFDYKYTKGERWYKAHFPLNSNKKITGEATPYYFFQPNAISRIAKCLPGVKIILMVRNPIDRAISSFNNNKRAKLEPLSLFAEAMEREERIKEKSIKDASKDIYHDHKYHLYQERGIYYKNYERLIEFFDKKDILVLEFNEFFQDLPEQYRNVLEFLNLDTTQVIENKIHNKGSYKNEDAIVLDKLNALYREPNERFFKILGRSFDWNR